MAASRNSRKTLADYDLSDRSDRYRARKNGYPVPKMLPGIKAPHFDSLIDKRNTDECWEWKGFKNRDGYGRYNKDGKGHMAHRMAWLLSGRDIPEGMVIMHSCDNPPCCNLNHLSVGTARENQNDKVAKGRHAKGESLGSSVLTEDQVREIRERYKFRKVTYKMLAAEYGVCKDTVQKAVRGIYWRHV